MNQSDRKSFPQNFFQIWRALQIVWKCSPTWTVLRSLILIIQGSLAAIPIYIVKLLVDLLTKGAPIGEANAWQSVLWLILLLGLTLVLENLIGNASAFLGELQTQAVTKYIYELLHKQSIRLDYDYYENSEYYDVLHRAQREATYRPQRIVQSLMSLGQNAFTLAAIIWLLATLHWSLVAILFLASIPGFFIKLYYSKKLFTWQRNRTALERRSWYLDTLMTTEPYAKELRLFNLGDLFTKQFNEVFERLRHERTRLTYERSISESASQSITTMAVIGALGYVSYQAYHGLVSIGDLVLLYQASQRAQSAFRDILSNVAALYEDSLFIDNFTEFLDLQPRITDTLDPRSFSRPVRAEIEFASVYFRYPGSDRPVLENISFTIQPGEMVALVGENGSGKTTLVKLLCRIYDPTQGRISIDGHSLKEYSVSDLRNQFSVVFQDYARYHFSARDNIGIGDIQQMQDTEAVEQAATLSGAAQIIEALPNRYETILGKLFQQGEELSTGQWQKIALARAFLRKSPIIILDEPTSALDAHAEMEVFRHFRQLAQGRTTLLISHRFSSVRMADRIIVLQEGRIEEMGRHDELVAQKGLYAHLYESQASHYRD